MSLSAYQLLSENEKAELVALIGRTLESLGVSLNELAHRAGVAQSMAYGVQQGRIKYETPNVRRLKLYAQIALGEHDGTEIRLLDRAIMGFIAAGGTVVELHGLLAACTSVKLQH